MTTREPCPSCREKGEDKAGDNLARYPDGGAFCFKCKYQERPDRGAKKESRSRTKLSVSEIETYPIGGDPERLIPAEIWDAYGVRCSFDTSDGSVDQVFYPYTEGTTVTQYKCRRLEPRSFAVTGELPGLFGKLAAVGPKRVAMIVEGEEDAVAAKTMISSPIHVYSLPNGANIDTAVKKELDYLSEYNKIYVVLDADTPGKQAASVLADLLVRVSTVFKVDLDPTIGKDASDYWRGGHKEEFLNAVKAAPKHEPEGVVNGCDITLEDLVRPIEVGYTLPYPVLNNMLKGLRKAEITTVCAGTGIGKTTLCREITSHLIKQGASVANVALEDQMNVTAQALVALDMNIPLYKFRMFPPAKEDIEESYKRMVANGRTFFYKHFAGINSTSLLDKLYYYAMFVDIIVLDHLSLVVSSSKISNERQAIDNLMTDLAKLVVETGVGLLQVVHLKRPTGDKSFSRGGEVALDDLRGSAAIEQLSWNVIGLERDQQGDDKDFSRIRLLKNRTCGFLGPADVLKYDATTGRLNAVAAEEI